jgi:D-tyrosyl-tRNA(Tyr) deacylase
MRVVLQRVKEASVEVNNAIHSQIGPGLLLLVGVEPEDTVNDISHLCYKIARLRIFSDKHGKMNKSFVDLDLAECLVVSQFTLFAQTVKGHRPSFQRAASPEFARLMIEMFVQTLSRELFTKVETGIFGADMKVALINDGPVTLILDSKIKDL